MDYSATAKRATPAGSSQCSQPAWTKIPVSKDISDRGTINIWNRPAGGRGIDASVEQSNNVVRIRFDGPARAVADGMPNFGMSLSPNNMTGSGSPIGANTWLQPGDSPATQATKLGAALTKALKNQAYGVQVAGNIVTLTKYMTAV